MTEPAPDIDVDTTRVEIVAFLNGPMFMRYQIRLYHGVMVSEPAYRFTEAGARRLAHRWLKRDKAERAARKNPEVIR